MSFGLSVSHVVGVVNTARRTWKEAKQAAGEHSTLTLEVLTHHTTLKSLLSEIKNSKSPIRLAPQSRRQELNRHLQGCRKHLAELESILQNYNTLGQEENSGLKACHKIQFGNDEAPDLWKIRQNISLFISAIQITLHLVTSKTLSRIEEKVERSLSSQVGGDSPNAIETLRLVIAKINSTSRDGSVMSGLTDHPNDDRAFWKEFRRGLIKAGFKSKSIDAEDRKKLLWDYIKELKKKGVLERGMRASQISLGCYREDEELPSLPTPILNHPIDSGLNISGTNQPESFEMQDEDEAAEYLLANAIDVEPSAPSDESGPSVNSAQRRGSQDSSVDEPTSSELTTTTNTPLMGEPQTRMQPNLTDANSFRLEVLMGSVIELSKEIVGSAHLTFAAQTGITRVLCGLSTSLSHLRESSRHPASFIRRASAKRTKELNEYILDCENFLRLLRSVLKLEEGKMKLGKGGGTLKSKGEITSNGKTKLGSGGGVSREEARGTGTRRLHPTEIGFIQQKVIFYGVVIFMFVKSGTSSEEDLNKLKDMQLTSDKIATSKDVRDELRG